MKINLVITLTEMLNLHLNEIKEKNKKNLKKDHIMKVKFTGSILLKNSLSFHFYIDIRRVH